LQYLFYKNITKNQIINIILISENKFILCDEYTFKIFIIENNEINQIGEKILQEGKIHKLFYLNGKIIIVNIKDTM
jgi:translation elongation factor P/translation initiation factor 5A